MAPNALGCEVLPNALVPLPNVAVPVLEPKAPVPGLTKPVPPKADVWAGWEAPNADEPPKVGVLVAVEPNTGLEAEGCSRSRRRDCASACAF